MKDKEKQIEEMALQFAKKYCKACGCESCDWAYEFGTKEESCEDYLHYKQMAEHFYNLGYRKLPKDSVVLSREEYELWNILKKTWASDNKEVSAKDILETLKNTKELRSKETAAKIYLQAKAIVDATKYIVQGREYLHIDALKEIIKSCGVEIKE